MYERRGKKAHEIKWIKNILSICQHGDAGTCPYCGGDQVVYEKFDGTEKRPRGYLNIICKACNEWTDMDGTVEKNR